MTDEELLALCDAAISQIASKEEIGPRAWIQHGFDQIEKFVEACDPDTIRALVLRAHSAEARVTELEQQRERDRERLARITLAIHALHRDIEAGRL